MMPHSFYVEITIPQKRSYKLYLNKLWKINILEYIQQRCMSNQTHVKVNKNGYYSRLIKLTYSHQNQ